MSFNMSNATMHQSSEGLRRTTRPNRQIHTYADENDFDDSSYSSECTYVMEIDAVETRVETQRSDGGAQTQASPLVTERRVTRSARGADHPQAHRSPPNDRGRIARPSQSETQKLKAARRANKKLRQQIKELKDKAADHGRLAKDAQERLTTAQDKLETSKDALWELQRMPQVPDSHLVNLMNMVWSEVSECIDAEARNSEKMSAAQDQLDPFTFGDDIAPDYAYLSSQHPAFGEYLAMHVMYTVLSKHIFHEDFLLDGAKEGKQNFLKVIEQSMSSLQPSRGESNIRNWRSETLTALAATQYYEKQKREHGKKVALVLAQSLKSVFPNLLADDKSLSRIKEGIIIPAIDLATQLQTGFEQYHVEFPKWDPSVCQAVTMEDLQKQHCVDIKNRKNLKAKSPAFAGKRGYIGRALLAIEPGLTRRQANGKMLSIRPIKFVVEVAEDTQDSKQSASIEPKASVTGDGAVGPSNDGEIESGEAGTTATSAVDASGYGRLKLTMKRGNNDNIK